MISRSISDLNGMDFHIHEGPKKGKPAMNYSYAAHPLRFARLSGKKPFVYNHPRMSRSSFGFT
jgi:hypothetical protein